MVLQLKRLHIKIRSKLSPHRITTEYYDKNDPGQMILRDHLAVDRTILANESTLLAYIRTAIAIAAVGITVIKLFPSTISLFAGAVTIGCAAIVLVTGFARYFQIKLNIETVYEETEDITTDP